MQLPSSFIRLLTSSAGANKPALADAIWPITENNQTGGPTGDVHFVLDGGALLHRVPWPRGITYDGIWSGMSSM